MKAVKEKPHVVAHLSRVAVASGLDLRAELGLHVAMELILQCPLSATRGPCDVLVSIRCSKEPD